ncbi:MAG: DUF4062 domain-containing protein [Bacteroidales bacterium]|nr:DUF4062 domain-containing protein [Bacteroidales bacterium]
MKISCFISSTFRDMNVERSYLSMMLFPSIRNRLFRKGIEFSWVDLRWGITDEAAEAGLVVPLCLSSIDGSDLFIGIIGDYYGTTLKLQDIENLPISSTEKSALIGYLDKDNLKYGISITELEILHGALKKTNGAKACFFFKKGHIEFEEQRITRLKEKVKESNFPIFEYADNEQLGCGIDKFIADAVSSFQIVETTILDSMNDREYLAQQHFLNTYLNDVHTEQEFEFLNNKVLRISYDKKLSYNHFERFWESNTIYITGVWGCGKTSFLANWIHHIQQTDSLCNVVYYFINNHAFFNSPFYIANYLCDRILAIGDYKEIIDESKLDNNPIERLQELIRYTHLIPIEKPLVIVLDGIDCLQGDNDSMVYAKKLSWIGHVHPQVLVVASYQNGDEIINSFNHKMIINIKPQIEKAVAKTIANSYLGSFHKVLTHEDLNQIIDNSNLRNPLFLKQFLSLLISCENDESLHNTINSFSRVDSALNFLIQFFNHLDPFFTQIYKEFLFSVSVSRDGYYYAELVEIIKGYNRNAKQFANDEIISICFMLDRFFAITGNTQAMDMFIGFRNDIVKAAAIEYLKTKLEDNTVCEKRRNIIKALSGSMVYHAFSNRMHWYADILHQAYEIRDAKILHESILYPDLMLNSSSSNDFTKYWSFLYDNGFTLSDYFNLDINTYDDNQLIGYCTKIIDLAIFLGNYKDSIRIISRVLGILQHKNFLKQDSSGYFVFFSEDFVNLLVRLLKLSADCRYCPEAVYALFLPLELTLQDKGLDLVNRSYFHHYTYLIQCDILLKQYSTKAIDKVYGLLNKVLYNALTNKELCKDQRYFIILLCHQELLLLSALAAPESYYRRIVSSIIEDSGYSMISEAIQILRPAVPEYKLIEARVLLYSHMAGIEGHDKNKSLDFAIDILNSAEKSGSFNINRLLVWCYLQKIAADAEDASKYYQLLQNRAYSTNHTYSWSLTPDMVILLRMMGI